MALRDPVAVYNAANNVEAHLVRNALETAGIEAFVTEDVSQVGVWLLGLLPEIHKPQVWIERSNVDASVQVLADFERHARERDDFASTVESSRPPIRAVCDQCGQENHYPAVQQDSVQHCRHCAAYLDVGRRNHWGELGPPSRGMRRLLARF